MDAGVTVIPAPKYAITLLLSDGEVTQDIMLSTDVKSSSEPAALELRLGGQQSHKRICAHDLATFQRRSQERFFNIGSCAGKRNFVAKCTRKDTDCSRKHERCHATDAMGVVTNVGLSQDHDSLERPLAAAQCKLAFLAHKDQIDAGCNQALAFWSGHGSGMHAPVNTEECSPIEQPDLRMHTVRLAVQS